MNAIPVVVVSENGIPVIPQGGSSPITETDPIYTADKPNIDAELQRIPNIENRLTAVESFTEIDPVWNTEKVDYDTSSQVDTKITNSLANYYNKSSVDSLLSWESAHKGNTTNLQIQDTEVDITSYLGNLTRTTFGSSPIIYDAANNRFRANPTGKSYSFVINYRLSGNLSGSSTTITVWRLNIRRASDDSLVTYKTFAKDSGAPTSMVNEDLMSFITRVYGDADPYVTNGFKFSIVRVSGTQGLTLSGNQQLFFNR